MALRREKKSGRREQRFEAELGSHLKESNPNFCNFLMK